MKRVPRTGKSAQERHSLSHCWVPKLHQTNSYTICIKVHIHFKHTILIIFMPHFLHRYPQNFVSLSLVYIFKQSKKNKITLCWPTTLGCGTWFWSIGNIQEFIHIAKVNLQNFPARIQILTFFVLNGSVLCCHNHFSLICASALLCKEFLCLALTQSFEALRGNCKTGIPFKREHPQVSYSLYVDQF